MYVHPSLHKTFHINVRYYDYWLRTLSEILFSSSNAHTFNISPIIFVLNACTKFAANCNYHLTYSIDLTVTKHTYWIERAHIWVSHTEANTIANNLDSFIISSMKQATSLCLHFWHGDDFSLNINWCLMLWMRMLFTPSIGQHHWFAAFCMCKPSHMMTITWIRPTVEPWGFHHKHNILFYWM